MSGRSRAARGRARTRRRVTLGGVAILAVVAGAGALRASSNGVHLSADSLTYLGTASQLAHGKGWTYPFGTVGAPVTLFPPLYPGVLAAGHILRMDQLRWALWVNAATLAATTFLAGFVVLTETDGSPGAALTAAVLVAAGEPVLRIYTWAWSESLFLPFEILALWFVARAMRDGRWRLAAAGGVATGLAIMTRYAGLALLGVACVALLVAPGRPFASRVRITLVYAAAAIAVCIPWTIRNLLVSGTITGAHQRTHTNPLSGSQVTEGLRVIESWLLPRGVTGSTLLMVLVVASALVLIALVAFARVTGRTGRGIHVPALAWLSFAFCAAYFVFILAVNTFSTRAPPLVDRILSPIYPPAIMALVLVGHALWARPVRPRLAVRAAVATAAAAMLLLALMEARTWVPGHYGQSLRSAAALSSLAAQVSGGVPPGSERAYSNVPPVGWYASGLPTYALPATCGASADRLAYAAGLRSVAGVLSSSPGVVVILTKAAPGGFGPGAGCRPVPVGKTSFALQAAATVQRPSVVVLAPGPS